MKFIRNLILTLSILLLTCTGIFAQGNANIYRLYNGSTGEHLYTSSHDESIALSTSHGWTDEGIGWVAPESGDAVYRLYNPSSSDHLYTTDSNEVNVLTSTQGWSADNNGAALFYSGGEIPVYRLCNPTTGRHHLTTDANEYNVLGTQGWQQEGATISAVALGQAAQPSQPQDTQDKLVLNVNPDSYIFDYLSSIKGLSMNCYDQNSNSNDPIMVVTINENNQIVMDPLPAGDYRFYHAVDDYTQYPNIHNTETENWGYFLGFYGDLTVTSEMAGRPGTYDLEVWGNMGG